MATWLPSDESDTDLPDSSNPASGKIELFGLEYGKVKIIDNFGRIILKAEKPGSEIDISALAPGIYFLQISSDNQWITKKIIKK